MRPNSPLQGRLGELSAERRAALEKLLSGAGSAAPPRPAIPQRAPGEEAPLSSVEKRLYFLSHLDPASPWYNICTAIRMQGSARPDIIRKSFEFVASRHEILRAFYPAINGVPSRSIAPQLSIDLRQEDLSAFSDQDAELERLLVEETGKPFDLQACPLFRVMLVRLADQDHVLLLTIHHIIADGISINLLLRESLVASLALKGSLPPLLPELPIQYADYALFEHRTGTRADDLSYWKEKLADAPPLLALPSDRPRPAIPSKHGRRLAVSIEPAIFKRLQPLYRQQGTTLFVTLLTAFGVLVSRYTGLSDIVIGSPVAGRDHPELENLIGCFVNSLVLRLDFSGSSTFLELMDRVREVTYQALEHQALSFERLVEELQPARSRSYAPLFQVMFNLQRFREDKVPGFAFSPVAVHSGTTTLDLTLSLTESDEDVTGYFEFNTDLFDESTIQRMAGHFETLLAGIVDHPERPVSAMPLLTGAERRQLLSEWNDTAREWPPELIPAMFEAQVARAPDAVASVFDGTSISYAGLNGLANRIAHALLSMEVGHGSRVGVLMEKCADLPAVLLGILKAGAAYVPLDPEYPVERLRLVIEDAGLSLLLAQDELLAQEDLPAALPLSDIRILRLSADRGLMEAASPENPASRAGPMDAAYVMYTSGSTGRPKGVIIPHRALVNHMRWMQQDYPLTSTDRVLQRTTFSFDLSVWEIFAPLIAGATLIIPFPADLRDLRRQAALVREQQVSIIQFVPSLLREILDGGSFDACASLRRVFSGGEALPCSLVRRLAKMLDVEIISNYGPTEACIGVATRRCAEEPGETVCLGRPIPNTQLYILDSHLQPVPVGVPGELYISGVCLALGYLNLPKLTAERFLPHPFNHDPEARLYRTGDMARYRPDGIVDILGRTDHQVKIRGYRIELEEVEGVLRRRPDVGNAAAAVHKDALGDRRLVAYIVPAGDSSPSVEELHLFLKVHLPDYMVPSQFVFLSALPLSPNGKLNRGALPEPESHVSSDAYVPPADALEARLARLWERLLDVSPIGRNDNFFLIGGHSLLALRMFSEIERDFSSTVPVTALFEAPTVAQLAGILRSGCWTPRWTSMIALKPSGRKAPFFCVHADSGHVFFYQDLAFRLDQDRPLYAFESRGLDGITPPNLTIEEMASHYIKEMRDVQPEGPYFLGGFCFGAYIALEMAHQLQAQGKAVPLLVSFSTDGAWKTVHSLADAARLHRRHLASLDRAGMVSYFVERLIYRLYRLTGAIARGKAAFYRAWKRPVPAAVRAIVIRELNFLATRDYVPRPYQGPLLYFGGSEDIPRSPEHFWGKLVSRIETQLIRGNGIEILREPGVQSLAQELGRNIERFENSADAASPTDRVHSASSIHN